MATVSVTVRLNQTAINSLPDSPSVQADQDNRARRVLGAQRRYVPVDTGRLSRSLTIRKVGRGRQIGSFGVEYAIYVETGHHTRSGSWVPAQPYIRPSLDAAR